MIELLPRLRRVEHDCPLRSCDERFLGLLAVTNGQSRVVTSKTDTPVCDMKVAMALVPSLDVHGLGGDAAHG